MSRKPEKEKTEKKPFSVEATYQWEGDAEFILKGYEIDAINKVVNIELSTKEAVRVQNLLQLKVMLNKILEEAYDDGILREYVEPPKDVKTETPLAESVPEAELVEEAVTE